MLTFSYGEFGDMYEWWVSFGNIPQKESFTFLEELWRHKKRKLTPETGLTGVFTNKKNARIIVETTYVIENGKKRMEHRKIKQPNKNKNIIHPGKTILIKAENETREGGWGVSSIASHVSAPGSNSHKG